MTNLGTYKIQKDERKAAKENRGAFFCDANGTSYSFKSLQDLIEFIPEYIYWKYIFKPASLD